MNSFYIQLNEEEGWLLLSKRYLEYVGPAVPMHLRRHEVLADPWYFVRIMNQFLDDGPWVEMRWADDAEYAWPYCVYCRRWVDPTSEQQTPQVQYTAASRDLDYL